MRTRIHSQPLSTLALLLLSVLFITTSCTQDSVLESNPDDLNVVEAKSSNAEPARRAIRGKINNKSTSDPDAPDGLTCFDTPFGDIPLTTNDIFGNMTHLGKIQANSFGVPVECVEVNPETFTIESVYRVNYIGAHGDAIHTVEYPFLVLDPATEFTTGTFSGEIVIDGGTGRFENATGMMKFVDASFVGDESTWEVVGWIEY